MEDRIVQFIAGLRASGVRVSLAETQDAMRATSHISIEDRNLFHSALKATLIKERADGAIFDKLFPLYFSAGGPPLTPSSDVLSPDEQDLLRDALRALAGELNDLLKRLLKGQNLSQEELEKWARRLGADRNQRPENVRRLTREMLRQMGLEDLLDQIEKLLAQLAQLGMSPEALNQLRQLMEANAQALSEQAEQYFGQSLARRLAEQPPDKPTVDELMDRPFNSLSESEARELRREVTRLAARLRSRASLRQRKGAGPTFDAKSTIRANVRHGGVPFEMHWKKRRLKPKFALICDVSTSMRPVVDFLLRLIYEMQDQVGKARSFAFIDHIEEVTDEFTAARPETAIPIVLRRLPPGYYSTDLGLSLDQFVKEFGDAVDRRTTLIFCGDGRNNYNDPRLDLIDLLKRRAKRVVWFNPEAKYEWGTGDSDMLQYAPLVDAVHQVSSLRQLTEAVDKLFGYR
ncbi:MAG: VWA domain-containing protein [Chloroflexi bacterium]|nr:VWA domain-containing protein [Chloroflexota bacterium]